MGVEAGRHAGHAGCGGDFAVQLVLGPGGISAGAAEGAGIGAPEAFDGVADGNQWRCLGGVHSASTTCGVDSVGVAGLVPVRGALKSRQKAGGRRYGGWSCRSAAGNDGVTGWKSQEIGRTKREFRFEGDGNFQITKMGSFGFGSYPPTIRLLVAGWAVTSSHLWVIHFQVMYTRRSEVFLSVYTGVHTSNAWLGVCD